MVPTLLPGQSVLVDPRAYRVEQPVVGDVVLIRHPLDSNRDLVKRVHAIGQDGVFVTGDNAAGSTDSRHFGVVSKQLLLGQLVCTFG